ncbi:hypothetical protein C8R45DRAFT_545629 [Mycena sanguinolenta]|nr:hypothetical protein C8R45DRAFT_545629 [Mycena sanguinolenta]
MRHTTALSWTSPHPFRLMRICAIWVCGRVIDIDKFLSPLSGDHTENRIWDSFIDEEYPHLPAKFLGYMYTRIPRRTILCLEGARSARPFDSGPSRCSFYLPRSMYSFLFLPVRLLTLVSLVLNIGRICLATCTQMPSVESLGRVWCIHIQ